MLYMLLKRFVVGPVMNQTFKPDVEGLENIPAKGGAILASNHLSFADSVFLPVAVDRQVYFLAKSEYFTGQGIVGRATAAFFKGINQIPMDRSGGKKSAKSLSQAAQTLADGKLLGIYPEGTRSPDGRLYKAKVGVARLALESGVPVIPVAMINTEKVQPKGHKLPRRTTEDGRRIDTVRTIIGEPLDFSQYAGRASEHAVQRTVADEIIQAIQRLSGQEYVDVYAATVKAAMEKQRVQDAKAAVSEVLDKAKQRTQASVESARASVENAKERIQPGLDRVEEKLHEARARVDESVKNAQQRRSSGEKSSTGDSEEDSSNAVAHEADRG
ncbi:1-acyl-sn-glycerol-3-phosphate acyltransferase [Kocuria sp. HSID16901]|nr:MULTISPECIES: lysophospholipid acyltransferase family protein [Kocuria]RUQ20470.1 1-acyl-sn-glycerol-3-phosphate acyltransferase [Kocuria sp. HSID16901]